MITATRRQKERLPLTPREKEVLHLLMQGLIQKEAADALGISVRTVAEHVQSAQRRIGAKSLVHLIVLFYETAA